MVLTGLLLMPSILLTSFVSISVVRDSLVNSIDNELRESLGTVSTALMSDMIGSPTVNVSKRGYLLDSDGEIVAQVGSTAPGPVDPGEPDLSSFTRELVLQTEQSGMTVRSADGEDGSWRVVAAPQADSDYTVVTAEPLGWANGMISAVTLLTLSFGVATLLVALTVGWILITRAFTPLKRVEATAAAIAAGDLSQRISGYSSATEVGQLSMSLNRMLGQIEDAFDARTHSENRLRQFVADASHELRTPLVSIRGYSELYRHGALDDDEKVSQAMGRIESEATRMTQLVEDLLSLARVDNGRALEITDVDLLVLAHDAAADFAAAWPDRRITVLGPDDSAAAPVWTRGDDARLRQVVVNLMTNAVRYTPQGTDLEIIVENPSFDAVPQEQQPAVPDDESAPTWLAQLKIRDHGPGIKGPDRTRIFERFYRADTSRTRETGGTGLGLSIVASVVGQHGGVVTLEETPGGGATFVVTLPGGESAEAAIERAADADDPADQALRSSGAEAPRASRGESGTWFSRGAWTPSRRRSAPTEEQLERQRQAAEESGPASASSGRRMRRAARRGETTVPSAGDSPVEPGSAAEATGAGASDADGFEAGDSARASTAAGASPAEQAQPARAADAEAGTAGRETRDDAPFGDDGLPPIPEIDEDDPSIIDETGELPDLSGPDPGAPRDDRSGGSSHS
ncbi:HAMP domain-containing protein [Kocuria palustris]|nr:HAMP domain-containing protein [Kocuria palustris]MBN6758731.1 HAMP domain-containing protein [Kocuria palustris]MBN6763661.1 HAMP domain-containing protein [Kocuria palustris]MBN6782932.1 HAMP domain-containing protein [Kocuria palustris]MBN6799450.1 HAMP domain-containing protein [Kocuria palustris]